ncbi:hypothetical protein [Streptomyces sp. Ru72]|uniref:hypothetical protein n=1 Tax=Streptomyces sp. Ru72 TaxID=2080747 RepID=UPI0015E27DBC|nr:hypothetical protein [Streptomyces sp. Ru72]
MRAVRARVVVRPITTDAQGSQRREPVGERITARIALMDGPGGELAGRRPL